VPVVICTGLYKLAPLYPYDEESLNQHVAPDSILSFERGISLCVFTKNKIQKGSTTAIEIMENVDVINPWYDYVPSDAVSIFITNQGAHPPSYIYRLLTESYHPEDQKLEGEYVSGGNNSSSSSNNGGGAGVYAMQQNTAAPLTAMHSGLSNQSWN
jgi:translation initiation factor eIF-2B subunit beta